MWYYPVESARREQLSHCIYNEYCADYVQCPDFLIAVENEQRRKLMISVTTLASFMGVFLCCCVLMTYLLMKARKAARGPRIGPHEMEAHEPPPGLVANGATFGTNPFRGLVESSSTGVSPARSRVQYSPSVH